MILDRKVHSFYYPFWPYSAITSEISELNEHEKEILREVFDAGGGDLIISSTRRPSDLGGAHRLFRAMDFRGSLPLLYEVFNKIVERGWKGGVSLGIDDAARHLHLDDLTEGQSVGRAAPISFYFFELDRKYPTKVVGYYPMPILYGSIESYKKAVALFEMAKERAREQYNGSDSNSPGWGWTIAAGLGGLAAGIVLAQSENVAASTIKDLALQKIKRSILPTVAGALAGRAVDYASHYAKRALDALPSVPGINGPAK